MVTRGERMLRRCGYVSARNGYRCYRYAGRADIQEATCECVLELSEDGFGRWGVRVIDQFGDEDEGLFGLTSAEMEAVAVKIRELEKERDKSIRKRLRAWNKYQRKIRRAAKRKIK